MILKYAIFSDLEFIMYDVPCPSLSIFKRISRSTNERNYYITLSQNLSRTQEVHNFPFFVGRMKNKTETTLFLSTFN